MTRKAIESEKAVLEDYIPVERFRTIPRDCVDISCGVSEKKVVIDVSENFRKNVKMKISSAGRVYGFVKMNDLLKSLNKSKDGKNGYIDEISFTERKDDFLVTISFTDRHEKALSVTKAEVKKLLEGCIKPISQRI